ncbi:unnamed protein product, partial [Prorocentrum cordatum]
GADAAGEADEPEVTEQRKGLKKFCAMQCGAIWNESPDPCDPQRKVIRWEYDTEDASAPSSSQGSCCWLCGKTWRTKVRHLQEGPDQEREHYAKQLGKDNTKREAFQQKRSETKESVIKRMLKTKRSPGSAAALAFPALPHFKSAAVADLGPPAAPACPWGRAPQCGLGKAAAAALSRCLRPSGRKTKQRFHVRKKRYQNRFLEKPDDLFYPMAQYRKLFGDPKLPKNKALNHVVCVMEGIRGAAVPGSKGDEPMKIKTQLGSTLEHEESEDLGSESGESAAAEKFADLTKASTEAYNSACRGAVFS